MQNFLYRFFIFWVWKINVEIIVDSCFQFFFVSWSTEILIQSNFWLKTKRILNVWNFFFITYDLIFTYDVNFLMFYTGRYCNHRRCYRSCIFTYMRRGEDGCLSLSRNVKEPEVYRYIICTLLFFDISTQWQSPDRVREFF